MESRVLIYHHQQDEKVPLRLIAKYYPLEDEFKLHALDFI